MSAAQGSGMPPPGFPQAQASTANGNGNSVERGMEGDFFGQLSKEEIDKKARKWRTTQKRRWNEKRKAGGGGGIDFGKAVSRAWDLSKVGVRDHSMGSTISGI
jgi:pre-mRNA-processing factor 8